MPPIFSSRDHEHKSSYLEPCNLSSSLEFQHNYRNTATKWGCSIIRLFEKGKTHWQLCFTKITPPPAHQTIFCQKLSKTFLSHLSWYQNAKARSLVSRLNVLNPAWCKVVIPGIVFDLRERSQQARWHMVRDGTRVGPILRDGTCGTNFGADFAPAVVAAVAEAIPVV